ncbi:MAG: MerR family transcriptional regulator [Deltaproteobacteria bacterium]|nr:MerR family transcriptional regulator [Deltaproteobacteria bacterium]
MLSSVCTISRVARYLNVSVRTIRNYEAEGFIRIERINGRCYLQPEEVELIALITRLRNDLRVNLAGVGAILEMRQKILDLQKQLDQLKREIKEQELKNRHKND